MADITAFKTSIKDGYTFKGDSIVLGAATLAGEYVTDTYVSIPLKTLNRHGLIAGATGTGKTKTLQIIAEQLSLKGIPTLLMDLKGDLSGLAKPGDFNESIRQRHERLSLTYQPQGLPVELLSLSEESGVRLRATVSEFGPVLFSKILGLNDTQSGIVALLFKYADDNKLPLLDLKDFKRLLQYSTEEGKVKIEKEYGRVSSASIATILRKIIELEQQGAEALFGERSFEVDDLLRQDDKGNGIISILRLTDMQSKPKLFSTFMLSLLAEIYSTFPEEGDSNQPKLVIFIDEAHLVFSEASKALLNQIETIIKLIRSKGVGVFFCTQNPTDIPDAVLSQLGLKVQHALRAFTAKDRKMIKQTAENYPISSYYKTDEALTSLGIGEALVTALNEKGIPTPLAVTYLRAPISRMDILSPQEIREVIQGSVLVEKYNESIDRESAYEILENKISQANTATHQQEMQKQKTAAKKVTKDSSFIEEMSKNTMVRQLGRTVMREMTRGLLGVLGIGVAARRTTTKKKR